MPQKLLTKELARKLPRRYAQEKVADPIVHAKFFNPCGRGTWYVLEFDPDDREFFAWCDLGDPAFAELGYVSLDELESLRLPFGLRIERDAFWTPCPLSEVKEGVRR